MIRLRTVGLGCVALAALHLARFGAPEHAIDDAWISFRIARNWVEYASPRLISRVPPWRA